MNSILLRVAPAYAAPDVALDVATPNLRSTRSTGQVSAATTIRNATPATEGGEDGGLRYGVQFDELGEGEPILVRGFVFEQLASRAGGFVVRPAA